MKRLTEITSASRAYLAAQGLSPGAIDQALTLHAVELAAHQRLAHDTQRPRFHMGLPCQPAYQCGVSAVIDLIDPTVQEES